MRKTFQCVLFASALLSLSNLACKGKEKDKAADDPIALGEQDNGEASGILGSGASATLQACAYAGNTPNINRMNLTRCTDVLEDHFRIPNLSPEQAAKFESFCTQVVAAPTAMRTPAECINLANGNTLASHAFYRVTDLNVSLAGTCTLVANCRFPGTTAVNSRALSPTDQKNILLLRDAANWRNKIASGAVGAGK